jgi:hypothetical protein
MKKTLLISLLFVGFAQVGQAQNYSNAIGLRGGLYNGITFKHNLSEANYLEVLFTSRWKGAALTALYEIHKSPFADKGFNWYYGAGGHIGAYQGKYVKWADENRAYTAIGVDGIIGIEYTFTGAPFNLSLDYKPAFDLIGNNGFFGDGGAFSIRYTF